MNEFRLIIFSESKEINDENKYNDTIDIRSTVIQDIKLQLNGHDVVEEAE